MRVLIVDDDVDFRSMLRWQLDAVDACEVVGDAADGHEALEQVRALAPQVAVVDLMMPGMDGFELIHRLRESHPEVAAVAYSATASDHARGQLQAVGVQMLTKSGDPAALVDAILRLEPRSRERPTPA